MTNIYYTVLYISLISVKPTNIGYSGTVRAVPKKTRIQNTNLPIKIYKNRIFESSNVFWGGGRGRGE